MASIRGYSHCRYGHPIGSCPDVWADCRYGHPIGSGRDVGADCRDGHPIGSGRDVGWIVAMGTLLALAGMSGLKQNNCCVKSPVSGVFSVILHGIKKEIHH